MDIFEIRTMLAALDEMKVPKTFLLDTFFNEKKFYETEAVDIDIIKSKRKIAPFVSPLQAGKVIARDGFTTMSIKPPYIKLKRPTVAGDAIIRSPGEIIYAGNKTPLQRASEILGKDLVDLRNMIIRREEWMAAQALFTGSIIAKGKGIDIKIDFLFNDTHKIKLKESDYWTGKKPHQVVSDLRTWKKIIAKDSGLSANICILGGNVVEPFIAAMAKVLDSRRVDLGMIDPQELPGGVTYIGHLNELGLDIYSYDEWYLDDDEKEKPMIPEDYVLLGSTNARTSRSYGLIKDLKALYATDYFAKSWEYEDPSVRWLLVQSAPLVIPHQVDGFLSAHVV